MWVCQGGMVCKVWCGVQGWCDVQRWWSGMALRCLEVVNGDDSKVSNSKVSKGCLKVV